MFFVFFLAGTLHLCGSETSCFIRVLHRKFSGAKLVGCRSDISCFLAGKAICFRPECSDMFQKYPELYFTASQVIFGLPCYVSDSPRISLSFNHH